MNRYHIALSICIVLGPLMFTTQIIAGSKIQTAIVLGLGTIFLALTAMHLGLWVKSER